MKLLSQLSLKKKILGVFLVISVAAIAYIYSTSKQPPGVQITNSWRGVTPGQSTDQVISKLGQPKSIEKFSDSTNTLIYDSGNEYHPHKLYVEDDNLGLIIERDLNTAPGELSEILSQYGDPAELVANTQSPIFYLYVYPQEGLAFNANGHDGAVREIWRFPPTTLEQFKQDYKDQIGEPPTDAE